ncbi:MAG TPA: DNA-3-methyladenine glycosylase 2 family protein [Blastocatellia bacterium]|nr:DNA-3-methyladenine glycosylase 2 family protein [Blastocatellia bacterium]
MNNKYLDEASLARGVRYLSKRDADLARIVKEFGPPPMWEREEGFHTLIHIILEQQVSLASARAAYNRLLEAVMPLTPAGFLKLDDASLKRIGFSRQKTDYGRALALAIRDDRLNLAALGARPDAEVKTELMKVKGIGHWTADIYLLMALRRPDIWPSGDLALAVAVERVKRLSARPTNEELTAISHGWRPWRAVAARLLWHFYLSSRR